MKIPESIKLYLQVIDFALFEIHSDNSPSARVAKICQSPGFQAFGILSSDKNMLNNRKTGEKHTAAKESMPTGGFSRKGIQIKSKNMPNTAKNWKKHTIAFITNKKRLPAKDSRLVSKFQIYRPYSPLSFKPCTRLT